VVVVVVVMVVVVVVGDEQVIALGLLDMVGHGSQTAKEKAHERGGRDSEQRTISTRRDSLSDAISDVMLPAPPLVAPSSFKPPPRPPSSSLFPLLLSPLSFCMRSSSLRAGVRARVRMGVCEFQLD
jgi:hypothetical protein